MTNPVAIRAAGSISAGRNVSVRLGAAEPSKDVRAGLVSHLRQLIDSHETGTAKVLGLEERLGKIRDQFQDRMIAQEQRITEMDRALQEKEKLLNESRKPKPQTGASTQFS